MTVRRLKMYTGQTGFVYQYYFVGSRPALHEAATEYVFDVTTDRKTTYSVSIFLRQESVSSWEEHHGRKLVDAEHYASVKMRLFQAFDEFEDMMRDGRSLTIGPEEMEALLAQLSLD